MRTLLKNPLIFLTALYTLAWGPMLLMRGAYWDGWILFSEFTFKDFSWVRADFSPTQNLYHYYVFRFLEITPDPALIGRAIVFFSWLIAGLILYQILKRFFNWNAYAASLVSAYFLVYPTFIVRFEFIHFYYSFSMLCFAIACYVYLDQQEKSRFSLLKKLLGIPLLVLAFFTNSFVLFYFGFLGAHFVLFSRKHSLPFLRVLKKWLWHSWYLLALPFAFMAFISYFFSPYGDYEHYNRILLLHPSLAVLSLMIEGAWGGLWAGFLWPIADALMLLERKYFAVILVVASVILLFLFRGARISQEELPLPQALSNEPFYVRFYRTHQSLSIIILGATFLFLGLFPYVVVGKYPHIYGFGFGLRHSLLMSLGSAFVLFGTVVYFVQERFQMAVHLALISLCVTFLWFNFILLDIDWYKQQAIIAELPAILSKIEPPSTIVFQDDVPGYNWLGRLISTQDYQGFLRIITGTWEYQGVGILPYKLGTPPLERPEANPNLVRIVSDRNWDDPKVTEWVYLKWIELVYGEERLRTEAPRVLQISLVHDGGITR